MTKPLHEQIDEFIKSITQDEKDNLLLKYDLACLLDASTVLKRLEGRRLVKKVGDFLDRICDVCGMPYDQHDDEACKREFEDG